MKQKRNIPGQYTLPKIIWVEHGWTKFQLECLLLQDMPYFLSITPNLCSQPFCPVLKEWSNDSSVQFSSVHSLSHVRLFMTSWTAAHQASLSITNSWSLLKLMSIELVMSSNHLILCCPLLLLPSIFPTIRFFSNESLLHVRWPKYWSFSFSILPMNIQNWFPLGCTGWLYLQSRGLSRVLSNTTVQKH